MNMTGTSLCLVVLNESLTGVPRHWELPGWVRSLDADGSGLNHGLDFLRTEAGSQKDLGIPGIRKFIII
jgi:hypothetical protein